MNESSNSAAIRCDEAARRNLEGSGSARGDIEAVRPRPPIDKQIWGIYIILVCISLIELYSASSREVSAGNIFGPILRDAGLLGVGFLIMLGLQRVHYNKIYKWTYVIVAVSVLATIYTMFWGNVITGAHILYILGCHMKEQGQLDNNTVVTTVMSNFGLYKAFDKKGIEYAKTAVGDKYVYEYMAKNGCRVGGEQSGHIIISK